MDCASLERYLEAYLEGRLRRAQWLVLRRHVMTCPQCRARVEELRQFEVDLHQRFRAMARTQRLWTGLELDLVGLPGTVASGEVLPPKPSLPPARSIATGLLPAPARSSRASLAAPQDRGFQLSRWPMVAMICLVLASGGTGAWLLVRPSQQPASNPAIRLPVRGDADGAQADRKGQPVQAVPAPGSSSAAEADPLPGHEPGPEAAARPSPPAGRHQLAPIEIAPADVPAWLEVRLGRAVDLRLPAGFTLLGGSGMELGDSSRIAVLAQSPADGQVLILPTVDGMISASAEVLAYARREKLAHLIHRQGGVTFDVLGAMSPARLDELFLSPPSPAPASWAPPALVPASPD